MKDRPPKSTKPTDGNRHGFVRRRTAPEIRKLRAQAISHSLFEATSLQAAILRLGFVQADPIRAPARAQDLILRHRVEQYRAGDLERHYPSLDIEEAKLHIYGFLPRPVAALLQPRLGARELAFDKRVLDVVSREGAMHPRDLDAHFARKRVVNGWGGYSQATKRALERLHHRGALRVVRRENGVRVYEAAPPDRSELSPSERLRALMHMLADQLAPVQERTLLAIAAYVGRSLVRGNAHRSVLRDSLESGELQRRTVDGIAYIGPATDIVAAEAPPCVRFLSPFDPLVWDRDRFEHLWHWPYRFEAYTPPAKRLRGYYALPMLWRDAVIGWVNAEVDDGRLHIEPGFVDGRPAGRDFTREFDLEVVRMERFLDLGSGRNAGGKVGAAPSYRSG